MLLPSRLEDYERNSRSNTYLKVWIKTCRHTERALGPILYSWLGEQPSCSLLQYFSNGEYSFSYNRTALRKTNSSVTLERDYLAYILLQIVIGAMPRAIFNKSLQSIPRNLDDLCIDGFVVHIEILPLAQPPIPARETASLTKVDITLKRVSSH